MAHNPITILLDGIDCFKTILSMSFLNFSNSEQQNITDVAKEKLNIFIMGHMNQYFKLIKRRIELEVCFL